MNRFSARWRAALASRAEKNLLRQRRDFTGMQATHIDLGQSPLLSFCSNDYLGLAAHPELQRALADATLRCGVGSGASHMVCGHHHEHSMLEEELAVFTGRDKALVFGSGYAANLSVLGTLATRKDVILQDKLNHASLLDGALLSGARSQRYLHADMASLRHQLERFSGDSKHKDAHLLVATDGVFSMDGDVAPLQEMVALCEEFEALLVVDDAHGLGVLGDAGRGSLSLEQLSQKQVPVLIGTFGKAFGTAGAFVAGPEDMIDYLAQFARPYIYTTAMPPALAAATRKSLQLVREGAALRKALRDNIAYFREQSAQLGLDLMESHTAIQPLVVGDSAATMAVGAYLEERRVLVGQIRPPTVPEGKARLRITLSATHAREDIDTLMHALKGGQEMGLL